MWLTAIFLIIPFIMQLQFIYFHDGAQLMSNFTTGKTVCHLKFFYSNLI